MTYADALVWAEAVLDSLDSAPPRVGTWTWGAIDDTRETAEMLRAHARKALALRDDAPLTRLGYSWLRRIANVGQLAAHAPTSEVARRLRIEAMPLFDAAVRLQGWQS